MSDAHRNAFVHESQEGITELNNALLALEADPDDEEAMGSIFRIAHTLKGNAAAMGYEQVSGLAHALEDLLDEVRAGDIDVTTELMDLLFDGVDYLDAMVSEIADEGSTTITVEDLETELRAIADGEVDAPGAADTGADSGDDHGSESDVSSDDTATAGAESSSEDVDTDTDTDTEDNSKPDAPDEGTTEDSSSGESAVDVPESIASIELAEEAEIYQTTISLGDTAMPGVDSMFILSAVEDTYEEFATVPDRDQIEDGEFEESFTVFIVAETADEIEAGLSALSQVETVSAVSLGSADSSTEDDENTTDEQDVDVEDSPKADDAETDPSTASSSGSDRSGAEKQDKNTKNSSSSNDIASVRVDVNQLDELYTLVEQLVTRRIKLRREMEEAGLDSDNLDELDKITANLQNTAMDMRLIPLSKVVDTFPRVVRDVARNTGKDVNFSVSGADIELDRTILTEIRDPLIHILRNAVDHGIEPPDVREEAGKTPTGSVSLTATRERDHVTIEVADDGAGLDVDVLKSKAIEKGVKTESELELMDDSQIYNLIFHPGFSTAEEVTDVSGRGVGMDVVHNTVKQLDGTVSVDSELGEGTVVRLRLPVTVAIVKVMFVEVGGTEYGIPVKNIAEVTRAKDITTTHGDEIIKHDDDIYPVLRLSEVLDEPSSVNGNGMLLRIRDDKRQVALHCDTVLDQEEVVVKPLEGVLSGIPGLSGTAVLGDGDVVAVLDVVTL